MGEGEQQNKLIRPLPRCCKTCFSTSQTGKKVCLASLSNYKKVVGNDKPHVGCYFFIGLP